LSGLLCGLERVRLHHRKTLFLVQSQLEHFGSTGSSSFCTTFRNRAHSYFLLLPHSVWHPKKLLQAWHSLWHACFATTSSEAHQNPNLEPCLVNGQRAQAHNTKCMFKGFLQVLALTWPFTSAKGGSRTVTLALGPGSSHSRFWSLGPKLSKSFASHAWPPEHCHWATNALQPVEPTKNHTLSHIW
jgi:hypothetical protein